VLKQKRPIQLIEAADEERRKTHRKRQAMVASLAREG
jgi:hypothetical protein